MSASLASTAPLAVLEVLDRDGHVRQQVKVQSWPLRVGRAFDNDWVLDDPHTAERHFTLSADETGAGVRVEIGNTVNGLWIGERLWPARAQAVVNAPVMSFKAGETVLRLRLATQALAPEQPIEALPRPLQGRAFLLATALLCLAMVGWQTWLTNDPGDWVGTLGTELVSSLATLLGWCGAWALLSKVMTRRSHFVWHVRVALLASLAWELTRIVPSLLAFMFSLPWLSSFGFVLPQLVLAVAVAFHLRQVEPKHPMRRRVLAGMVLAVGLGLNLWLNLQSNDRWGQDLYLTHLYPPELRLAPARDLDHYMQGVAKLQEALDEEAAQPVDEEEADEAGAGSAPPAASGG